MLFVFRTIPLRAAFLQEVFCFLHVDPLPPQYLGLTIVRSFPEFFPGTMTSADFLQFVVTTHFFQYVYFMRLQDLPGHSHILSLHLPAAFTPSDSV